MIWLAIVLMLFPLAYAALVATQTNAEVFSFQLTPGTALSKHFDQVWNDRNIPRFMWNSMVQAILITSAKTVLSLLAGLAFVYFSFRGKWIVFYFVLITLMMPTEVMILALFRFVSDLGWKDTMAGLVVPFAASATGAFLFRQHFANLPRELPEAAQIDGAGPVQFLFRILIPLSWNVIGALAVIQFIFVWNMYLWPVLIISDQDRQVVQVGLQGLQSIDVGLTFGPLMLAALITSIPPVLVFIVLQKPFMSGFALTADK
jgi:sn-glycerol 3-phosphate transport system permease protein